MTSKLFYCEVDGVTHITIVVFNIHPNFTYSKGNIVYSLNVLITDQQAISA